MNTVPCKSCGKLVVWATLPSGSRAPFDAETPRDLYHLDNYGAASPAALVYRIHFATCPNAEAHRKPRNKIFPHRESSS